MSGAKSDPNAAKDMLDAVQESRKILVKEQGKLLDLLSGLTNTLGALEAGEGVDLKKIEQASKAIAACNDPLKKAMGMTSAMLVILPKVKGDTN